jgi:hypothetical protein
MKENYGQISRCHWHGYQKMSFRYILSDLAQSVTCTSFYFITISSYLLGLELFDNPVEP